MPMSPNSPCRTVIPEAARVVTDEAGNRFCAFERYRETLPGGRSYYVLDQMDGIADDTPVHIVPDGHYIKMGDNREDSLERRLDLAAAGAGDLHADYPIGEEQINQQER